MLTKDDIAALRSAAQKAPQGKWRAVYEDVFDLSLSDDEPIASARCDYRLRTGDQQNDLAAYIASLSPDRILALCDAADALRELVECEALKDRIDNNDHDGVDRTFAELHAMTEEYQRRKPLAWSRASAIVGDKG